MKPLFLAGCLCAATAAAEGPALRELQRALDAPDAMTRADACDALRDLGAEGRGAVAALLGVAEADEDPNVREAALGALVQIGVRAPDDLARVVDLAAERPSDALRTILAHAGAAAIEPLTRVLADAPLPLRRFAARTLGQLRSPGSAEQAFEFEPPELRLALPRTTVDALGRLLQEPETAEAALYTFARLTHGEAAHLAERLLPFVAHEDHQLDAIRALGRTRSKAALSTLAGLLEHRDVEVACEAALAVARFGSAGRGATPALVRALTEGDPELRARAAEALGAVGGPPAWAALIAALADAPLEPPRTLSFGAPETWRAAEAALRHSGGDAREAVDAALPGSAGGRRRALERVLAAWEAAQPR